jgi:hypothetical protein
MYNRYLTTASMLTRRFLTALATLPQLAAASRNKSTKTLALKASLVGCLPSLAIRGGSNDATVVYETLDTPALVSQRYQRIF